MKKLLIMGVTVGVLLSGCDDVQTEKADSPSPSKEQKVEKADGSNPSKKQRVEKSESDVKCDPDVPGYKQQRECSNAQSMSEAAEALANHEMTLEDLNKISSDNAILLGTCQMVKYEQENGAAAMKQWTEDFVDEVASAASASDVVSI